MSYDNNDEVGSFIPWAATYLGIWQMKRKKENKQQKDGATSFGSILLSKSHFM